MKLFYIFALTLLFFSCNKREENAMKIAGVWDLTETVVTNYENNKETGDSIVEQSGQLVFEVTGGLDNPCSHDINYAPCIDNCFWDFPRKKEDQLFFYYYDEDVFSIYSSSCMVQRLTKNRLELLVVNYDNDLNIHKKTVWKFKRNKL